MNKAQIREVDQRAATAAGKRLRDLSDEERRTLRVQQLMREASINRLQEARDKEARRQTIMIQAARDAARKAGVGEHDSHLTMVHVDEDGKHHTHSIVLQRPSAAVLELLNNPRFVWTGLMWQELTMKDRAELLDRAGLPASLTFTENVAEIFPEATKEWLLGWQRELNTGTIWNNAQSVGDIVTALIDDGYLLFGPEHATNEWCDMPSRTELTAGRPGTVGFVRAIMGQAYLDWLLEHEAKPIVAETSGAEAETAAA